MGQNLENENLKYTLDIDVSNDYYKAYLIIDIVERPCDITEKEIEEFLDQKNISHGIDYSKIEEIIEKPEDGKYLIAEGKKHVNGKDAEIEYFFETDNKIHPTMEKDGSVDYKHMHLVQRVKTDEVLAKKTKPTEGKKGYTVTGKEINPKKGKDVNFKVGKNVKTSEDGLKLMSEIEGAIKYENGRVSVEKVIEVSGVGVSTGNIDFHGKVVVNGVVESGYEIQADNDIVINGIVEGSKLVSGGDITITKGVQGNDQAYIECKGELRSGFINSSEVKAGKDILVDIIMHSKVSSNGALIAKGKKGTVVGGSYNIKKGIEAKVIGSEMGTITNLKVGIDNELLQRYKEAKENKKKYGKELLELNKNIKTLKTRMDNGNRNQIMVKKYKKSLNRLKDIQPKLEKAKKTVKESKKKFANLKGSKIKAQIIYPGTKVNITNSLYNVKKVLKGINLVKRKGEVKLIEG
ncbi:MAG: DUF342 domain-containing protein [Bacillota bacterium]